jgi:hypothetical protein
LIGETIEEKNAGQKENRETKTWTPTFFIQFLISWVSRFPQKFFIRYILLDRDYLLLLVALLPDELFPDEDEAVLDDLRLEEDGAYEFDRLLELELRGWAEDLFIRTPPCALDLLF